MLILGAEGDPALLVGNECYGMAGAAPVTLRRHLFQDLSLPSQPRDRSQPLATILAAEGVAAGSRIGVIGWKPYADRSWLEVPSFLADTLRGLTGPSGLVENANDILIDPRDGLRTINEVEQLAVLEHAACQTSSGVRNLIRGLRPGMTEREAVRLLDWNGSPLSCHLMLSAGPRASLGLLSPSDRRIERGDRFTVAFGIWGALDCRAGFVVADASELPAAIGDYVERLVGPYFEAVAEWYAALRVGVPGGTLQDIIDRHIGDPFFGVTLNPGHLIHLDEWVSSPVYRGSTVPLRSGMAMQVDIIPATGTDHFTTNIENGIALADETLRAELATAVPGRLGSHPGPPAVHARCPGHRPAPGCAALLQHPGVAAAVPVGPRSRHDDGRVGDRGSMPRAEGGQGRLEQGAKDGSEGTALPGRGGDGISPGARPRRASRSCRSAGGRDGHPAFRVRDGKVGRQARLPR